MKLTDEQIEKIYQSFDCLIPKSLIKKVLKKVLNEKVFKILDEIETNINDAEKINADKHIIKCCCDC